MNVLVCDVGGHNVKILITGQEEPRKLPSGPALTPQLMVHGVKDLAGDWKYDVVSIGYPGPIRQGRPAAEPHNLGSGWVGFDWEAAFGCPVRMINDAAMQALGSYRGGRMLFLGLGTGLGSALLWNRTVLSLELGDLPYIDDYTMEDYLGDAGLEGLGAEEWEEEVQRIVPRLKKAFIADYVVLGGGNAKRIDKLPKDVELGHNRNAFTGGCRLWQNDARTRRATWNII